MTSDEAAPGTLDALADARAAVGVTGAEPLPSRGGWLAGVSAMALMASVFGVLARLVVDRHAVASMVGMEPSEVDDRSVRILLWALVFVTVLAVVTKGRRFAGIRLGISCVAAVGASALLAGDVTTSQLDLVVLASGLALGTAMPGVPASLASRVQPGERILAMRLAAAGLPVAMVIMGIAVVAEAGDSGSVALALLGLLGVVTALRGRGAAPGLDQVAVYETVGMPVGEETAVPMAQLFRRVTSRVTIVHAGIVGFATGSTLLALPIYLMLRLEHDFLLVPSDQAFGVAMAFGLSLTFLAVGTWDVIGRHARSIGGPSRRVQFLLPLAGLSLVVGVLVDASAAIVVFGAITVALTWSSWSRVEIASVVSAPHDVRVAATTFLATLQLLGAVITLVVVAGVDRRFGTGWGLALMAVPLVSVAGSAGRIARSASKDLDRTLTRFLGAVEIDQRRSAGVAIPLLEARGIDFSYGQVQVLFDVDFSVDDGEMVALLGTNGAGKSTLLRVISGLGLPSSGIVRYDGNDVTYSSPSDRVHLGIAQVPGGKAAFGPLTVVENLRVHGHALGRDKAALDRGIEAAFAQFPRLAERRNQAAQTLSGGEQQMLALSKALILKPRLLLIDELSLGLAPVIVAQLLQMVREINQQGTAVVLVEQSVNVALQLAHHAYYMEKGEVRFDGASKDLLERPDVLRSVYLKGAAAGLGGAK